MKVGWEGKWKVLFDRRVGAGVVGVQSDHEAWRAVREGDEGEGRCVGDEGEGLIELRALLDRALKAGLDLLDVLLCAEVSFSS